MVFIKNRAKVNRRLEITMAVITNTPLQQTSQNLQYDNQLNTIGRVVTINQQTMMTQTVHRDALGNTNTMTSSGFIKGSTKYNRDSDDYNISNIQTLTNIV